MREHAADGAVNVRHGARVGHLLAPLNRRFGSLDERLVEGQFQAVVLDGDVANSGAGSDGRGRREDLGEIDAVELIAAAENLRVGDEQIRRPTSSSTEVYPWQPCGLEGLRR